ncbi:hypothetical protein PAPHI01_1006 [Pancytospora philotis]|nr:hypothetical protein PAPHI01_1006 [Pancytospora philotis]
MAASTEMENAKEDIKSECTKLPMILGGIAVGCVILFLLCTQCFWDSSIMLNTWLRWGLLACIIPFCFIKCEKKKANIGAIVGFCLTLFFICVLFYYRNKVTRFYINGSNLSDANAKTIESHLNPSGVVLLFGDNVALAPGSPIMNLDVSSNTELGAALAAVLAKKSGGDASAGIDSILNSENLVKMIDSQRWSGIIYQGVINLTNLNAVDLSSFIDSDEDKKKHGITTIG